MYWASPILSEVIVSKNGLVYLPLDNTSSMNISESGSQYEAFAPKVGCHLAIDSKDWL